MAFELTWDLNEVKEEAKQTCRQSQGVVGKSQLQGSVHGVIWVTVPTNLFHRAEATLSCSWSQPCLTWFWALAMFVGWLNT